MSIHALRTAVLGTGIILVVLVSAGGINALIAHFDRRPEIVAPKRTDLPPITFERSLPNVNFAPDLAWSGDSALLISSTAVKQGFRVQTVTGEVVEEHTLPYGQLYHEILSDHEIITQTYLRGGVPFEAVDLRNGRVPLQGADPPPHDPYGAAGNVRFATDGDRSIVAVGFGPPHSGEPVAFYDTRTWAKQMTLVMPSPGPADFCSIKLSKDGTRLAYNAADAVMVLDVASGTVVQRLPSPGSHWFAFSPDAKMLAVAERGPGESHGYKHQVSVALHVFRLSDGTEIARREQPGDALVKSIEWDPRGRFLAYLDGDTIHLWKPPANQSSDVTIKIKSEIVGSLAISPDGNRMAVGDGYAIDVFRIGGEGKTTHY